MIRKKQENFEEKNYETSIFYVTFWGEKIKINFSLSGPYT